MLFDKKTHYILDNQDTGQVGKM